MTLLEKFDEMWRYIDDIYDSGRTQILKAEIREELSRLTPAPTGDEELEKWIKHIKLDPPANDCGPGYPTRAEAENKLRAAFAFLEAELAEAVKDGARLEWDAVQRDGRLEIGPRIDWGYYLEADGREAGWYWQSWDEFIEDILHGPYDTPRATLDAAIEATKEQDNVSVHTEAEQGSDNSEIGGLDDETL